jgi:DNA-binding CsgD family transcriptional regulator
MERLNAREFDVLRLLAAENGNKEIAALLHLREGYVKKLVEQIFATLGVHTRTGAAVRYAMSLGRRDQDAK